MEAILKGWVECDGGFIRTSEKSKRSFGFKNLWPDDLFKGFNPHITGIGMADRPNRNGNIFTDEMLARSYIPEEEVEERYQRFERMHMGEFVEPQEPANANRSFEEIEDERFIRIANQAANIESYRWGDAEIRHARHVIDEIDAGFERVERRQGERINNPLYQGVDFGRDNDEMHIQSTPGIRPNFFIGGSSGSGMHVQGSDAGSGVELHYNTGGGENENEPPVYDPEAIPRGVNPFYIPIDETPPEV